MLRTAFVLATAIGAVMGSFHAELAADTPVGLVQERPESGRYVETDRGYMVPYQLRIPGTEVVYEMEPIPGGTFTMGSPETEEGRRDDEGPQFQVVVEPFWMGKHEVTWAEYKLYMEMYTTFKDFEINDIRPVGEDDAVHAVTAPTPLYDSTFTYRYGEEPRQPAGSMTQFAAKQYTKWLSGLTGHRYRLPSEAEWEYACRAGTETAYYFGDDPADLDQYAWHKENTGETTPHVGLKKPNPWGLHDMHGNVAEWVLDEYSEEGYQKFEGKKVTADEAIRWPTDVYPRVVRGGSWKDSADRLRSASRMGSAADSEWKFEDPNFPLSPWWFTSSPTRAIGFRIMRPLEERTWEEMQRYWEADVEDLKLDVEDRLWDGQGVKGLVDPKLPEAIRELREGR